MQNTQLHIVPSAICRGAVHAHLLEQPMQVGKKWYGKSFSARRACASRKTSMSSNRSARVAGDCGALEQRSLRLGCDVFRRYQKSRQPVGSLTLASATQSLSSLSIDLICSRNSGAFLCPWAETACCTAASSTSRSEEHTSELQSRVDLVCRLLLEK